MKHETMLARMTYTALIHAVCVPGECPDCDLLREIAGQGLWALGLADPTLCFMPGKTVDESLFGQLIALSNWSIDAQTR